MKMEIGYRVFANMARIIISLTIMLSVSTIAACSQLNIPQTLLTITPTITTPNSTNVPSVTQSFTTSPNIVQQFKLPPEIEAGGIQSFVLVLNTSEIVLSAKDRIMLFETSKGEIAESAVSVNPIILDAASNTDRIAWVDQENTIFFWDPGTKQEAQSVATTSTPVTGLAISPEGNSIAYSTYDNVLVVREINAEGKRFKWNAPSWLTNLVYSSDGSQLGGTDLGEFAFYIFDIQKGKLVQSLKWTESASPALYGAFISPDWKKIAWSARGNVQIIDRISGKTGPSLSHEDFVNTIAWSPDNLHIATASAASIHGEFTPVVLLWNSVNGELLATLSQISAVSNLEFSNNGDTLFILDTSGTVSSWNLNLK